MFIKGFAQGVREVAFGAKKCIFGPRIAIFAKNPLIPLKWRGALENGGALLKMYSILQGIPTFWEVAK